MIWSGFTVPLVRLIISWESVSFGRSRCVKTAQIYCSSSEEHTVVNPDTSSSSSFVIRDKWGVSSCPNARQDTNKLVFFRWVGIKHTHIIITTITQLFQMIWYHLRISFRTCLNSINQILRLLQGEFYIVSPHLEIIGTYIFRNIYLGILKESMIYIQINSSLVF